MAREQANIYEIAKAAGVSVSTVSRVLTGNARVSAEKREKVEAAIRKFDYRPNALAQGLSTAKTNTIGALFADIASPFYGTMAKQCEKAADERGYMLLMLSSRSDVELEKRQLEKMFEQRPEAILIVGGLIDHTTGTEEYVELINRISRSIPVVSSGKLPGADNAQVCLDESGSMELAMDHLLALGHRRIALIGGWRNAKSTLEKRIRYRTILAREGIEYRESYVFESAGYDDESGYTCMKELLGVRPQPTAIIAINDYTAAGVLRAIHEAGKRVPEDYSLVSFDNTYISRALTPTVTSVGCDYAKFGEVMVETALKAAAGEPVPETQMIPVSLTERNSCRRVDTEGEI